MKFLIKEKQDFLKIGRDQGFKRPSDINGQNLAYSGLKFQDLLNLQKIEKNCY